MKKTASTWPPLQVALRSETDVFTLLPETSTSETARILIRTDSSAKSDEETKGANERRRIWNKQLIHGRERNY